MNLLAGAVVVLLLCCCWGIYKNYRGLCRDQQHNTSQQKSAASIRRPSLARRSARQEAEAAATTTSSSSSSCSSSAAQAQQPHPQPNKQQQLTLFSPCKINLFLRILRKRPEDGYHDLASLFQAIGFGDTLELRLLSSSSSSQESTHDDATTTITESGDTVCLQHAGRSHRFHQSRAAGPGSDAHQDRFFGQKV